MSPTGSLCPAISRMGASLSILSIFRGVWLNRSPRSICRNRPTVASAPHMGSAMYRSTLSVSADSQSLGVRGLSPKALLYAPKAILVTSLLAASGPLILAIAPASSRPPRMVISGCQPVPMMMAASTVPG